MHTTPYIITLTVCSILSIFCVIAMNPSGSGGPVQTNVGEAQRLSSLTFGCFQIRGKNPQVLTGPEPSQKSISTLPDQDHTQMEGRRPSTGQNTNLISYFTQSIANDYLKRQFTQNKNISSFIYPSKPVYGTQQRSLDESNV